MMTNVASPETEKARAVSAGTLQLTAAELVDLEKELVKLEKTRAKLGTAVADPTVRDLLRTLRVKRMKLDEKTANEKLSSGSGKPPELLKLAKRLAADTRFGLARRVLQLARKDLRRSDWSDDDYRLLFQKSALSTYKDPDLPLDWRLNRALEILREGENLATTRNSESLGLAGAIFKRKWEVDHARPNLERALFYYLKGYAQGAPEPEQDDVIGYLRRNPRPVLWANDDRGYTGINAAFLLDLLGHEEEVEARRVGFKTSEVAQQRKDAARLIREEIIKSVPSLLEIKGNAWLEDEWWFYATVGEAYFGLGQYDPANYEHAVEWLVRRPAVAGLTHLGAKVAGALDVPEWEYESTARQLARLAILQQPHDTSERDFEPSAAGRTLATFLEGDGRAVRSAFRGKFGLALSGGGFRASLFHIGVLARLAELGVLPQVEVLSCVSGGSIIGAHYYLELQRLLQTKRDDQITSIDYLEIVQRIEKDFLEGVQRNIRTRVLAEWVTNLKMIFKAGYSRTLRVGELYERELFSRVPGTPYEGPRFLPDWLARLAGWKRELRWIKDLYITPLKDDNTLDSDFVPRRHNWRRTNKAPILVLNSTTLNTGHTWQFTASYMGEPPTAINADIDSNDRLRRMWYKHAPEQHRNVRLGHAVAASSCVPGLFEPLILDGLYPDRSVRLVDGGVCDNQGTSSLLEQDCSVLLVSDASGQMESQAIPSSSVIGVPLRSNGILQARIREAQYTDVSARKRSSLLRGLMFIHLKQDLPPEQVAWEKCPSHLKESDFVPKRGLGHDATSYDVDVDLQRRLAAIRTDLDSFSDVEAYALMTSAYHMTRVQFEADPPCVRGFEVPVARGTWTFLEVEKALKAPSVEPDREQQRRYVARILDVGANTPFKIWKLSRPLMVLKWVLASAAVLAAGWFIYDRRNTSVLPATVSSFTFGALGTLVLTTVLMSVVAALLNAVAGKKHGKQIMRVVKWRDTVRSVLVGIGMATIGFILARIHLHLFDRLYLRYGRRERLQKVVTGS